MESRLSESVIRPHGLGVAVVFDWAIAAQLVVQAVAVPFGRLGQAAAGAGPVTGRLAGAAIIGAGGELLRRGHSWMRVAQVVLTAGLTATGVAGAGVLLARRGGHGMILSVIVELTFAPFIAVRLLSSETARWFAQSRGRGCAPRLCGPWWVAALVTWSAAWGSLVAWSQSL